MPRQALAVRGCAVLTPLDQVPGEVGGTWRAIRDGKRIERQVAVGDSLLDGDVELDRSIRLALAVAREAIGGDSFDAQTALFCATSKGPVGIFLQACERLRHGEVLSESIARQTTLGVGAMGANVQEKLKLIGPVHTSVAACASGLHALHRAAQTLWQAEAQAQADAAAGAPGDAGGIRRAIVVAADASLHPLFTGSFQRLGVMAPADDQGIRRCVPFGKKGEGFFVTEAAAALVLECQDLAVTRDDPPYAWLEESWIGGDGTGLIGIDPESESLRRGLRHAAGGSWSDRQSGHGGAGAGGYQQDIAFVHAHATGTEHDAYEWRAIRSVVAPQVPIFSSKGFLGHSLGAAGLVSVALSIQCHVGGSTLDGHWIEPDTSSLTVAQGFGGSIGVVRLRG